jgi:hypothetical protein
MRNDGAETPMQAARVALATAYNHFNWATTTEEIVLACHEIETAKARIGLMVRDEKEGER